MSEFYSLSYNAADSSDPSVWDHEYHPEATASVSELEDWPDILKRKNSQKLGAKVKRVYMHTQPKQSQANSWRLSGNPKPESRVPSSQEPLRAKVKRVNIYHPSSNIQPESNVSAEPTDATKIETEAGAAVESAVEKNSDASIQDVSTSKTPGQKQDYSRTTGSEQSNNKKPVLTEKQRLMIAVADAMSSFSKAKRNAEKSRKQQREIKKLTEQNLIEEATNNDGKGEFTGGKNRLKKLKHNIKIASAVAMSAFTMALAACTSGADNQPTEATAIVDSIKDIDYNDPNIGQDHRKVDLDTVFGDSEIFGKEGIYDGYGEKGMWLSSAKGGAYDFASAKEVAEVCGNDAREIVKYAAENQVECFADYLANLPEELQPEGFKGLTILETEHKLESLSKEDFTSIMEHFKDTMSGAFTREITLDGTYRNAYMRLIDPSKPATHDNMELVTCTTEEHGTKATEFYWTDDGTPDGNVIGSMIVKIQYDENGDVTGGCIQVILPDGTILVIYEGMKEVKENPPATSLTEEIEEDTDEDTDEDADEDTDEDTDENTPGDETNNDDGDKSKDDTENNDSKDAGAIKQNMGYQNRITQKGSGDLLGRPDTPSNSYQDELKNKEQQKDEARGTASESKQGVTVGDIINNADQTYANHGNFTEEQRQAQAQQAKAEEAQKTADNAAYEMRYTAQQNSEMSDAEAEEWFNKTISQGNNG